MKTEREKLEERAKKALAKQRAGAKKAAELQERVRRGELTAAQALKLMMEKE